MKTAQLAATAMLSALSWFAGVANAATATDEAASSTTAAVAEVTVTAEKREENIQTVPVSVQAFTAKDIQALGIKSSIDLGAVAPNVDIATPAGPGNQPIIAIRGIGLNDYDTNNAGPNGVYVDEVYLSSPASQTFQAFDLQRIEVLKGPQGTLYGRNTSGGAINFITRRPTDQLTADAHVEYGSYGTFNFEGAVGGQIAPGLDGRVAFVKNNSTGFMHNALTGGHENGTNNWAARGELQWKPTDTLTLLFNVHGGQVDNRVTEYRHIGDLDPNTGLQCSVADSYAGKCVDLFGYGTPPGFYDGAFNRNRHLKVNSVGGSIRIDDQIGDITLTSLSAFEHNDKIHPEDSDASPNRLLEIDFGVRNDTFTQELRASQTRDRYDWVVGAYYLYEKLNQDQPIYILLDIDKIFGAGVGDGLAFQAFDQSKQITNAWAVYGQGDYAITDKLKLTLGGRYTGEHRTFHYDGSVQFQEGGIDHFGPVIPLASSNQSLDSSSFNWRVAANYAFTNQLRVYASAATGFKSGDFNGSFLSLDPAEIARQLQPVKPEKVTAYEVGLKSTWFDRRLLVDAAAFYNDYRDLQVFVLVPPVAGGGGFPVNVLDNAKKAHTEGVELQVDARPIPDFTATVNMGWLETRLDSFVANVDPAQPNFSGKQLPVSPHFALTALFDYGVNVGPGRLDLQVNVNYKGRQFFDISNDPYTVQKGYWLENARLAYAFDHGRWEVAVFGRNLSDEKYFLDEFDLTAPFGFIQGIVGTPRTFGGEVNFKY